MDAPANKISWKLEKQSELEISSRPSYSTAHRSCRSIINLPCRTAGQFPSGRMLLPHWEIGLPRGRRYQTKHMKILIKTSLLLIFMLPPALRAGTVTWTNLAGGDWNNAANWSPNAVVIAARILLREADALINGEPTDRNLCVTTPN